MTSISIISFVILGVTIGMVPAVDLLVLLLLVKRFSFEFYVVRMSIWLAELLTPMKEKSMSKRVQAS